MTLDLDQFCSHDETRPYLLKPFSVGNFSYATNGYILVRVPRRDDLPEQEQKANWEKPLEGFDKASFTAPQFQLPDRPSEDEECEACDGRGYKHDCPHCECECRACLGSGSQSAEGNLSTTYQGITFALRYVRKMLALPEIEIADVKDADQPLLFRFEGGVGAVMPMRGPSVHHVDVFESAP